jgi:uncharacterized protein
MKAGMLFGSLAMITILSFIYVDHKSYMKMKPRITILTLGVEDLERSYKFYHEGLGFPTEGIVGKEFEHGAVVFIDLQQGMKLALYPRKDLAWDAGIPRSAPCATELSIGYNVSSKEEVDSVMELVKTVGATIAKKAQKTFWGGYAGYFQDPDGHLWEVAWNPQMSF